MQQLVCGHGGITLQVEVAQLAETQLRKHRSLRIWMRVSKPATPHTPLVNISLIAFRVVLAVCALAHVGREWG